MAKRGGLGKGLDALFMDNTTETAEKTISLRISEIIPNRAQPRRQFDADALAELADSISQYGVIQPLLVRPLPDSGYQLVAGERRWRAAQMAGLTEVPVVIREMSDQEMATLALVENLQREDLNPMEEALGYRTLMDTYSLTQEQVSQTVKKSRSAVANALRLLALPDSLAELVSAGNLSAGHARALLSFASAEEQQSVARMAIEKGLSVRDVERLAQSKKAEKPQAEARTRAFTQSSYYDEVALALSEHFGRKVTVETERNKNRLVLEFYSEEDLKGLMAQLCTSEE